MGSLAESRSIAPRSWPARRLAVSAAIASTALAGVGAQAAPHEAYQFAVPSGTPDEYMQAGEKFARELDPQVEVSYWDSQTGALSVSRVDGIETKCILRVSPDVGQALKPLGRLLTGRIEPQVQAMFAMAHEVGHCKMRDAFLHRPDGRAADASIFPWLAQEAAADTYGILSTERRLGDQVPVRQAVIIARMLTAAKYGDRVHATGHYVSDSLRLCTRNRDDADAVRCAIATAYYTVGSLYNDEHGEPFPVDSPPELIYELGVQKIAETMRVYDDIAQYKAQFSGADLRRFEFNEVSRDGESRYITAETVQQTDTTYRLADYYGFRTGELVTEDERSVKVLRIDGDEELDWLLTLGAVVRTEGGESLRKGVSEH